MNNNKKRKISKFGYVILIFLFSVVLLLLINIFKRDDYISIETGYDALNKKIEDNNSGISFSIIDTYESDSNVIEKKFSDGLSVENFKNILNQKENYISKSSKYKTITYNFDKKLHYSEIEDLILNINNSSISNVELIGKSVDNRNIYGIEIGKGDKVLYLDANIHAAEVASTLMLIRFLGEITNEYENNNKDIIDILNEIKIVCIPCINPDGYEVYNFGVESLNNKNLWWYVNKDKCDFINLKSNANGVDINRNFPSQNGGLYYSNEKLSKTVTFTKSTSRSLYYPGSSLGSEPETKACMYFMFKHYKNIYIYLNMHSQGRVIYSGKPNLSSNFNYISEKLANHISDITGYKVHGISSEEVGEGNDGTASDFMSEIANGFKFSSFTGRLSSDKYIDNSCILEYSFPVLTVETLNTYTDDVSVYKDEYYNHGIRKMLYSLLEYNN